MRKFLMAAAVLGVAACGEQTDGAMEDTTTMAPPPAAQMGEMADSMGAMADSMKQIADSMKSVDTTQH
jgi:hypothetical protein